MDEEKNPEIKNERKVEVGAIVEYHENHKAYKASITAVHSDTLVNLSVTDYEDQKGETFKGSVPKDDSDDPKSGSWAFGR